MSVSIKIKTAYLAHFSKPASDRPIFKAISAGRVLNILECGIGPADRAKRVIAAAQLVNPGAEINFTGVDLFEARCSSDGPGLSLILAHRMLRSTGAQVKLIPGDPMAALMQAANTLKNVDLMIISARQDADRLAAAWFYMPRMLHEKSVVFLEEMAGGLASLRVVEHAEILERAKAPRRNRAA